MLAETEPEFVLHAFKDKPRIPALSIHLPR